MTPILNTAIIITVFYLFYQLVLKKDTFFHCNRAFILFSLAIAAMIPWLTLDLSWWEQKPVVFNFENLQQVTRPEKITTVSAVEPSFNWMNLLFHVYLVGLVIFSLRFLLIIGQVLRIYVKGKKVRSGQHKLVLVDEMINPFSFFNHIYLPASFYQPGKNLEVILNHESVHQRQWHSLDRLLMELFLVYQWFNPLAWQLRKEMILVHEYLADHNLSRDQDQYHYQQSLLKHWLSRSTLSLGNNLNAHLKKRIKMMNRSLTPEWQKVKFVLALPLIVLLLFTCTRQEMEVFDQIHHSASEPGVIQGKVVDAKTGKPLPGTNVLLKGTTVGTVADLQGNFQLKVPANQREMVVSFINYNSLTTKLKQGYNYVTLKLTKDEYKVDWEANFSKVPLASNNEIERQQVMNDTRLIKGIVYAQEGGKPVPGANIILAGSSRGTVSDRDGRFSIQVPEGPHKLIFHHMQHREMVVEVEGAFEDIQFMSNNVAIGFPVDPEEETVVEETVVEETVVEERLYDEPAIKVTGYGEKKDISQSKPTFKRGNVAEIVVEPSPEGREAKFMVKDGDQYKEVSEQQLGQLYPESTEVVGYGQTNRTGDPPSDPVIKGESEAGVEIRSTTGEIVPLCLIKEAGGYREIQREALKKIKPEAIKSISVYKSGANFSEFQQQYGTKVENGVVVISLKQ